MGMGENKNNIETIVTGISDLRPETRDPRPET